MTNTYPADTRPRCGGTPGKPAVVAALTAGLPPYRYCLGCADCAPDTHSGPSHTETLAERAAHDQETPEYAAEYAKIVEGEVKELRRAVVGGAPIGDVLEPLAAFEAAVRAESAAALREARDYGTGLEAASDALRTDLRAAEQRLREVEEERDRLRRVVEAAQRWNFTVGGSKSEEIAATDLAREVDRYEAAASRPVPAATLDESIERTRSLVDAERASERVPDGLMEFRMGAADD